MNLSVQKERSGNRFPIREVIAVFDFALSARKEDHIAIYHLSIKIISRGKGKSAVAAAAYRAGEKIMNDYDGLTHDYTRKSGVMYNEILLPDHAPREYFDRATLWNAVEKIEKNCNSQLAREIELALPKELNSQQQIELTRDYCRKFFVSAGMCADICIHDKGDGNPHAHIMLTMRPIEPDGNWAAKSKKEYIFDENGERIILPSGSYKTQKINTVDWNEQTKAEEWRAGWAEMCNASLGQNNVAERIDHRSYERQGVEQIPTIHMGVAAFQMEKRGIRTERGDINRRVQLDNKMLRQLRVRINRLVAALDELLAMQKTPASPSIPISSSNLADVLIGILENPEEKTRRQKIPDLKTFAKAIAFLQQHSITNLQGLHDKVSEMYGQQKAASESVRKIECRMKTLKEHIHHADNYFQYRALYKEYKQQKPRKQESFYGNHRAGLVLYESAEQYLKNVMNGRTTIPIKAWKAETASLVSQKKRLYAEYLQLKEEVRNVEAIRHCVEQVVREKKPVSIIQKDTR